MGALAGRRETTIEAQLAGILPGDPPRINLVAYATGRNGTVRRLARQVLILDGSLFARLRQEVRVGDALHFTLVSEYRETGSITYLTDFKKAPDVEQEAAVKNGALNIVQNESAHFVLPPARDPKAKVEH